MRISNNQLQINSMNPNFGHYSEYRKNSASYPYWTTTNFFRIDLEWKNFIHLLYQKYRNVPKVNVRCFACSDGEEAFSLAMKLDSMLGDAAKKFFPIIAKDFDRTSILYGKKGRYDITAFELKKMKEECGMKLFNYIKIGAPYGTEQRIPISIKDNLKEKVEFCCKDILQDVKNLPSSNTVLLTRNMWPYLPPSKREILAENLSKQLDESSIIVLGKFDLSQGIKELLEKYGFEETEMKGVLCNKSKKVSQLCDAKTLLNKIKIFHK